MLYIHSSCIRFRPFIAQIYILNSYFTAFLLNFVEIFFKNAVLGHPGVAFRLFLRNFAG